MRHIKGMAVEVDREDGTVWGRTAPGAGWDDWGKVQRVTPRTWWAWTRTLSAWHYRGGVLMFEQVQEQRKGSFSTQREAVAFVVDERIAAGNHS